MGVRFPSMLNLSIIVIAFSFIAAGCLPEIEITDLLSSTDSSEGERDDISEFFDGVAFEGDVVYGRLSENAVPVLQEDGSCLLELDVLQFQIYDEAGNKVEGLKTPFQIYVPINCHTEIYESSSAISGASIDELIEALTRDPGLFVSISGEFDIDSKHFLAITATLSLQVHDPSLADLQFGSYLGLPLLADSTPSGGPIELLLFYDGVGATMNVSDHPEYDARLVRIDSNTTITGIAAPATPSSLLEHFRNEKANQGFIISRVYAMGILQEDGVLHASSCQVAPSASFGDTYVGTLNGGHEIADNGQVRLSVAPSYLPWSGAAWSWYEQVVTSYYSQNVTYVDVDLPVWGAEYIRLDGTSEILDPQELDQLLHTLEEAGTIEAARFVAYAHPSYYKDGFATVLDVRSHNQSITIFEPIEVQHHFASFAADSIADIELDLDVLRAPIYGMHSTPWPYGEDNLKAYEIEIESAQYMRLDGTSEVLDAAQLYDELAAQQSLGSTYFHLETAFLGTNRSEVIGADEILSLTVFEFGHDLLSRGVTWEPTTLTSLVEDEEGGVELALNVGTFEYHYSLTSSAHLLFNPTTQGQAGISPSVLYDELDNDNVGYHLRVLGISKRVGLAGDPDEIVRSVVTYSPHYWRW